MADVEKRGCTAAKARGPSPETPRWGLAAFSNPARLVKPLAPLCHTPAYYSEAAHLSQWGEGVPPGRGFLQKQPSYRTRSYEAQLPDMQLDRSCSQDRRIAAS